MRYTRKQPHLEHQQLPLELIHTQLALWCG